MSEIQELEAEKVRLARQVTLRDQILKLSENFEFRKVIHDGFLTDVERRNMLDMAMAAGHLQRYLSANVQMGHQAADSIIQIDGALEELRAEGAE